MRPGERSLPALDGVRVAAAFAIVVFHCRPALVAVLPAPLARLVANGYVAVSVLFVLSGFVLAQGHPIAMDAPARRRFLVNRVARLYPAHVLGFLLCVPVVLAHADELGRGGTVALAGGAYLLLVQSWIPTLVPIWNWPGWSTSVALWAAVAYVWALGPLSRQGRSTLLRIAAVFWAVTLVPPVLYLALEPDGALPLSPDVDGGHWMHLLKYSPPARVWEVLFGAAVGLAWARTPALDRARAGRWLGPGAAAILVVACASALPYPLLHNGLLLPAVGALLWSVASSSTAERLLARPLVARLANASFVLALVQQPFQYAWSFALRRLGLAPFHGVPLVLFLALAVAASVVLAERVEAPVRRWLRAQLAPPPAAAVT